MTRTLLLATTMAALMLAGDPPLEGKWTSGRISSIQYQNAYTGVAAPTSGNYFAYNFKADGTYTHTGMIQNTLYNCTTTLFAEEAGTYERNGAEIKLLPKKNPYRMTNSCSSAPPREGPGKLRERTLRVAMKGAQLQVTEDGEPTLYSRERGN